MLQYHRDTNHAQALILGFERDRDQRELQRLHAGRKQADAGVELRDQRPGDGDGALQRRRYHRGDAELRLHVERRRRQVEDRLQLRAIRDALAQCDRRGGTGAAVAGDFLQVALNWQKLHILLLAG